MALLFDLFGFLEVVVRFIALVGQALTVGGLAFVLLLVGPSGDPTLLRRSLWLIRVSVVAVLFGAAADLTMKLLMLEAVNEVSTAEAMGASFALAATVRIAAALAVFLLAWAPMNRGRALLLGVAGILLVVAAALTSHAISRPGDRALLLVVNALHQAGASVWIGGIPYLLLALRGSSDGEHARRFGRGFSLMSMGSVAALIVAGLIMAVLYIGSFEAIYGTAYGLMVSTKVVFLCGLLVMGAMNYRFVERMRRDPNTPIRALRARSEAEIGLGITVFAVAASLTSIAPAIDQPQEVVPLSAIVERQTPVWPRLTSPDHDTLAIPMLQAQLDSARTPEDAGVRPKAFVCGAGELPPVNASDIAWSEYNHHWAGLFVLVIGLLALLERSGRAPWARNWPLVFLGLALFLLIRSDPEAWPLGEIGFWESMRDAGVFQHRIIVLLVMLFGGFEWGVRTGRIKDRRAPYVFPVLTAIGAGMLLLHSHPLSDIKLSFLIEMTHIPMAILGAAASWLRYLELRLPSPQNRFASWAWPVCFVLIGLVLLNYREA